MAGYSLNIPECHGKGTSGKSRRDASLRVQLFQRQGGACHWCQKPMELNHFRTTEHGNIKENPKFASFEHLIPRSMGGTRNRRNLLLAHADCNRQREKRKFPHDPVYGAVGKQHPFGWKRWTSHGHGINTPEPRNRIKPVPLAETKRILTGQHKPNP